MVWFLRFRDVPGSVFNYQSEGCLSSLLSSSEEGGPHDWNLRFIHYFQDWDLEWVDCYYC